MRAIIAAGVAPMLHEWTMFVAILQRHQSVHRVNRTNVSSSADTHDLFGSNALCTFHAITHSRRAAPGVSEIKFARDGHVHCSGKFANSIEIIFVRSSETNLTNQTTLATSVETSGIGLHTAVEVKVRLVPAPPNTGLVFVRTDLGGFEIPAHVEYVAHCSYATTLMRTGVMLSTVEHLLAALRGANIDNTFIEVDNLELPIMDGSAESFTELIEKAGIVEQPFVRRALRVKERIAVEQGNRRMSIAPAGQFEIDCMIDFPHPMIGVQRIQLEIANGTFGSEISAARTFGFTEEIEMLQKASLIRGGSLDNAIVLTQDGMLNQNGLRFSDEFVRHKVLDIIGDLALLGLPIHGRVTAERSGHILHAALMTKLLRTDSAWEIVELGESNGDHPIQRH